MKLKTLILLERGVPSFPGSMTSRDTDLVPWDSVTEGKDWFLYCGANNWNEGVAQATITITEGNKPKKLWIKVSTKRLRRPKDTNEGFGNRAYEAIHKIGKAWCSEAKRLFKEPKSIDKVGNLTQRTWEEAFKEALESPRIKAVIKEKGESPMMDPVNFTPVA